MEYGRQKEEERNDEFYVNKKSGGTIIQAEFNMTWLCRNFFFFNGLQ